MNNRLTRLLLSAALGTGLIAPLAAQTPKAPPVLRGAIQDTLGQGIAGVQIEIVGLKRVFTTPGSGVYRFDSIPAGKYWVIARRIGYQPLKAALTLRQGDNREIVFQLVPLPYNLPEIKVQAENKKWERQYQDFVFRSKASLHGYFLTRDDLDASHAVFLGDAVRRYLPFVSDQSFFTPYFSDPFGGGWGRDGIGWTAARSRSFIRDCPPSVSVNGAPARGGWAVNDFRPEDVEAVEVYRSGREPLEFQQYGVGGCGLVVVWTR